MTTKENKKLFSLLLDVIKKNDDELLLIMLYDCPQFK